MSAGISVTPDALREKAAEIDAVDEWLDAVSGSKAAGKRAIKNSLIRDLSDSDTVDNLVNQIVEHLNSNNADEGTRAAFYFAFSQKFDSVLGDEADKFVDQRHEAEAANQEQVSASEDEVRSKLEQRKQLVNEFHALKGILEMFDMSSEIADIEDYQQRRGAMPGQKRKPRKINRGDYFLDGEPMPEDQNTLSGVASVLGSKVKTLKTHLEENGVDLKNPSDFEVEFLGRTITATFPVDEDDSDEVEDNDEDE